MSKLHPGSNRNGADSSTSTAVPSANNSMEIPPGPQQPVTAENALNPAIPEKGNGQPAGKFSVGITLRTIVMAVLTAMGGFIFGYDTGQISGFLEMRVFLERFGQRTAVTTEHPYGYYFSNVRSGLIVALVSETFLSHCQIANISSCRSEP
jgi:MFS transporter, SP family, sugar:H+ symporter